MLLINVFIQVYKGLENNSSLVFLIIKQLFSFNSNRNGVIIVLHCHVLKAVGQSSPPESVFLCGIFASMPTLSSDRPEDENKRQFAVPENAVESSLHIECKFCAD